MEHESLKLELYRTNREEDTKKMTGEWMKKEKKKKKDLENDKNWSKDLKNGSTCNSSMRDSSSIIDLEF